jgi:hypothetical protein
MARELAVPSRTSSRWYGGLRNAALSDEMCMLFVKQTQQEYARGEVHEHRAKRLFSLLKLLLPGSRGLSTSNLPGSLGFFQLLRNVRQRNAFEHAELIVHAALPIRCQPSPPGDFVTCLDHITLLQTTINCARQINALWANG